MATFGWLAAIRFILEIRGRDNAAAEPDRGRHHDGIDRRSHSRTGAKLPGETGGAEIQSQPPDAVDEQSIDAGVARIAPVYLRQDRQWDDPLSTLALCPTGDGKRSLAQDSARLWPRQRVDGLGVEDQEARQKRSASASRSSETGPASASSSSKSRPNASLSKSRRTEASTNAVTASSPARRCTCATRSASSSTGTVATPRSYEISRLDAAYPL
jgi:hypothetical protein